MATIYIAIILLCRVVQALFSKRSSNEIKNIPMLVCYTSFQKSISAILGVIMILITGAGFKIDLLTLIIAVFSGLALFFSSFCGIYAMKSGTVSLNSMFATAGMIVPIVAGVFLFGKPISLMQCAGVLLFFTAAWLLIGSSKKIYTNYSFKTFLLLTGNMLASGSTMLAQQLFTHYVPDGEVSVFSFLSFGTVAVLGGAAYLFMKKNKVDADKGDSPILPKILIICGVFLAIAVFIINQLATILTAFVPPVILFTFINGGGTIISTIVAALIYNETLSKRSAAGVLLGIASLVIIKMF